MRPKASRASSPNPTANLVGSRKAGQRKRREAIRGVSFWSAAMADRIRPSTSAHPRPHHLRQIAQRLRVGAEGGDRFERGVDELSAQLARAVDAGQLDERQLL